MADKLFELTKNGEQIDFHVRDNGLYIGNAYREVDGFYVFEFNDDIGGSWPDYALLEIGNELKELNREWEEEVKNIK